MNNKISVGITTYNRPEYFEKVYSALPFGKIDDLVVVNDGVNHYVPSKETGQFTVRHKTILADKQNGIAWAKNAALKYLLTTDCEWIFLIEDDVIIKDPDVFKVYIDHCNTFGIYHLNFLKVANNQKTFKDEIVNLNGCKIGLYHNTQGAFSVFHRKIVEKFGFFDEGYRNAFEHISYDYNLSEKGIVPPFWYFADVLNSEKYLTTIEGSDENSTITNKEHYSENWEKSASHFIKKHGIFTSQIPDVGLKKAKDTIEFLEKNYSRKHLVNKDKKLTVIIPYRDRTNALNILIHKLHEFLPKYVENFEIFVVEQDDKAPFNKGLMNNIGFKLAKDADYVAFHDVDLIPEISDYSYPENPTHLSNLCSQFNYIENPDVGMGGVVTFRREHFEATNGFPNDYSGWGKEDDLLRSRCTKANLPIFNLDHGRYFSVPHIHRLTDPKELEYHKANTSRWEEELSLDYIPNNGLSNLDLTGFDISKEDKKTFIHYKVKHG